MGDYVAPSSCVPQRHKFSGHFYLVGLALIPIW